jgi:O-methyltransferase involved in polyketide biosynthesis
VPKKSYEDIGPTAWIVAYARTFSDIPYSKEIFNRIKQIKKKNMKFNIHQRFKGHYITPRAEARYKLVNKLLSKNKASQILEIASGLSPRGLDFSEKGNIEYVEFDLPKMMAQKVKIIGSIKKELPQNLHLVGGNALDYGNLEEATRYFNSDKNVAVITEGLLRYLDLKDRNRVAKNIYLILKRFGGLWVTPDIIQARNSNNKNLATLIKRKNVIDIEKNKFKSVKEAKKFFQKIGFSIEAHKFIEVQDQLVSPKRLNITSEKLSDAIGNGVVFVMKIKKK